MNVHKVNTLIIFFVLVLSFLIFFTPPTFANSPDQVYSSLSASGSVPADGQTTAIITVTLHDSTNTPVVAHSVYISDPNNSTATIGTISSTTDSGGHALFSIKSTNSGTDYLNVTDTTSSTTLSRLGQVTFTTVTPTPGRCYDAAPGSAPKITSAVVKSPSQITLHWTAAADPVSYYLVSFGVESGQYIYGSSNIGGQGTISYTVNNLLQGKTYYFVVRAGNGCAPGSFSNEIAATTSVPKTPTPVQSLRIGTTTNTNNKNRTTPTVVLTPFSSQDEQSADSSAPTQAPQPTAIPSSVKTSPQQLPLWRILLSIFIVVLTFGIVGGTFYVIYKKYFKTTLGNDKGNQST